MKKVYNTTIIIALTLVLGYNCCFAGSPLITVSANNISSESVNIGQQGFLLYLSPDMSYLIFANPETVVSTKDVVSNIMVTTYNLLAGKWETPSAIAIDNNINKGLAKEIFFSKDEKGNKNIFSCFYFQGKCTAPVMLNENINSVSNETFAFLSADKNTLFFTSDRKGSVGGFDIWKAERLENGDWGIAQNLGNKVNTIKDEESPVILSDNATLYFSSKGHDANENFDIFTATLSDEGFWSDAESLGAPVNSPSDDMFYFLSKDEKSAFYTSSKKDAGNYIFKVNY